MGRSAESWGFSNKLVLQNQGFNGRQVCMKLMQEHGLQNGLFGMQIAYRTEYFDHLNVFENDCTLSVLEFQKNKVAKISAYNY